MMKRLVIALSRHVKVTYNHQYETGGDLKRDMFYEAMIIATTSPVLDNWRNFRRGVRR